MTIEALRKVTQDKTWRELAMSVIEQRAVLPASIEVFGTHWIEAGHQIRNQLNDDQLLCAFLRLSLPAYQGAELILYRGENIDRFHTGKIGLAWTPSIETAEMFGSGLNAINSGGLLLQATFPVGSVITGPNAHSQYLGEEQFTVDVAQAKDIKVLKRIVSKFPKPFHATSLTGWSSRRPQAPLAGALRASHSGAAYRER